MTEIEREEIIFYPEYQVSEWEDDWLEKFLSYLPRSFDFINQYIDLKSIPQIILIAQDHREAFIKENSLPSLTNGVFDGEKIYLLINSCCSNWQAIVNHEMFHAAVFQLFNNKPVIPVWFNESLAYYIGENTSLNYQNIKGYLSDYPGIKNLMLADGLMVECQYSNALVKSFGAYFGGNYSELIKPFFNELSINPNFKEVFNRIFNMTFEEAIDQWYRSIISQVNRGMTKTFNLEFNRDEFKYYDSFNLAVAFLAKIINRDYQLMFLNSWDFYCKSHNQENTNHGFESAKGGALKLLENYHRISLTPVWPLSGDSALECIREELINNRLPIIAIDTYWCPWNCQYQKKHHFQYCLVCLMDEAKQYFACLDRETIIKPNKPGILSFSNYRAGFQEIYCSKILPENNSYQLEEVLSEISRRFINCNSDGENSCDNRSNIIQTGTNIFRTKKIPWKRQIQLYFEERINYLVNSLVKSNWRNNLIANDISEKISQIINGRYQFAIALQYLAERFEEGKMIEFAEKMTALGDEWQKVNQLLIQYAQTSSPVLLDDIIGYIHQLGDREVDFAILLSEMNLNK